MYKVESALNDKLESQLKKILLTMGYDNGSGDVDVDYSSSELDYTKETFEVFATTYKGRNGEEDHTTRVDIPWKLLFNFEYEKEMELDKIRENDISELKRLRLKYPNIR